MKKIALASSLALFAAAGAAHAQSVTNFDSFATGSVNGQGGWSATGSGYDQAVVDLGGGNKAWRVSNAVTGGSFGDMPFSPSSGSFSGETTATHKPGVPTLANASKFYGGFDFASATGGAQPGLRLTVSPDDGVGRRQSFLAIEDNGSTGYNIVFNQPFNNNPITNQNGGFVSTTIASNVPYGQHNLAFDIDFVDGLAGGPGLGDVNGNDVLKVLLDGNVIHTGSTWESYHWTTSEGSPTPGVSAFGVHAVDQLMFRISGTAAAGTLGNGFLIDNVVVAVPEPTTLAAVAAGALVLLGRRRRRA